MAMDYSCFYGLPININDVMILPTKYICYHEHNFYVAQQIDFLLIKVQGYQQGSTKVDNYKNFQYHNYAEQQHID